MPQWEEMALHWGDEAGVPERWEAEMVAKVAARAWVVMA